MINDSFKFNEFLFNSLSLSLSRLIFFAVAILIVQLKYLFFLFIIFNDHLQNIHLSAFVFNFIFFCKSNLEMHYFFFKKELCNNNNLRKKNAIKLFTCIFHLKHNCCRDPFAIAHSLIHSLVVSLNILFTQSLLFLTVF